MRRLVIAAFLALASATGAFAQTGVGSLCLFRFGSGSPNGTAVGSVCDIYIDSATGSIYRKRSGTNTNTGWVPDGDVTIGGTGLATLTTNGVLYGNGTSAAGVTAQGPANSVLTANAGAPSFSATPTVTSLTATTLTANTSLTTPSLLAAANLSIAPTGDVNVDPTGNDVLPTTNFDINLGSITAKFLTLHAAELWVENLVAQDVMATIGGRVIVSPTTELVQDLTNVATTIHVKHNQIANGDRLLLMTSVGGTAQVEWMAVTSAASGSSPDFSYTVTRNLDGSGANTWPAGSAVMNSGTTGDGYIDLYSTSGALGTGVGPSIVGNVRTGTTYNNIAARWVVGNLNGLYGYATDVYGAAFGDASGANVTIDATNGFRVRSSTTDYAKLASGTFTVGLPAGNRLSFDGTNLTVVSANATIDSTGVAVARSSGTTPADGNSFRFGTGAGSFGLYSYDTGSFGTTGGVALLSQSTSGSAQTNTVLLSAIGWTGSAQNARQSIVLVSRSSAAIRSELAIQGTGVIVQFVAQGAFGPEFVIRNTSGSTLFTFTNAGDMTTTGKISSETGFWDTTDTDTGIDFDAANRIRFSAGATRIFWDGTQLFPENNGTKNLGVTTNFRWQNIYLINAPVVESDAREKKNVADSIYGTNFLRELRPVDYEWKRAEWGQPGVRYQGFLAQDVARVAPQFSGVSYGPDGVADSLRYEAFVAPLVKAFQELDTRVRALERRR